ncbi:cytochrome c [Sphingomonas sp. SORGH_AS802]|uniref:cytochrome c family protein n=1 Tax=unclassified Sphingomonas TaxID=196159 RepID=UPI00285455E9|nr:MULTISPECIES: cytochrome c family protein [unclassified Sphingomonas]MDR6128893.1 cytochrome c [Sphingomonas sp. SORGH_AS_0438]MDR6136096.1 cytochrome c [Sphingomonas sp. SORGH_AS_0802]
MDLKTNTIAGWALGAAGIALGTAIVGGMIFEGHRPEKMGYPIEGVEEAGAGGGAPEVAIASLLPTADVAKGAEVFKKCAACHTVNQGGANGVGPNLYATLGEAIAQGKGGFAFSDALKSVGGKWNFDNMNAWLTSPRKFAPGTKMTFAGLSNPQDRANVIAYLNAQGSNLPLPATPAPGAEKAAADTGGNTAAATEKVETDRRGETGDIANTGTPASGAPSVDPEAARKGARSE